jgi:hypothetical protein
MLLIYDGIEDDEIIVVARNRLDIVVAIGIIILLVRGRLLVNTDTMAIQSNNGKKYRRA